MVTESFNGFSKINVPKAMKIKLEIDLNELIELDKEIKQIQLQYAETARQNSEHYELCEEMMIKDVSELLEDFPEWATYEIGRFDNLVLSKNLEKEIRDK